MAKNTVLICRHLSWKHHPCTTQLLQALLWLYSLTAEVDWKFNISDVLTLCHPILSSQTKPLIIQSQWRMSVRRLILIMNFIYAHKQFNNKGLSTWINTVVFPFNRMLGVTCWLVKEDFLTHQPYKANIMHDKCILSLS